MLSIFVYPSTEDHAGRVQRYRHPASGSGDDENFLAPTFLNDCDQRLVRAPKDGKKLIARFFRLPENPIVVVRVEQAALAWKAS
jgi:hypothetical protein